MTIEIRSSSPRSGDSGGASHDAQQPDDRPTTKGARTREKILVTAGRHFARHGYSAATLRDIADDVGVTPAMVVRYFGNKRRLFEAVAQTSSGELTVGHNTPVDEYALRIIQYWQDPDARTPIALLRSLELDGGELFLTELNRRAVDPLTDLIQGEDADVRRRIASGLGLGFGLFSLGALLDPDQPSLSEEEIQRYVPYLARLLSVCLDPPPADNASA